MPLPPYAESQYLDVVQVYLRAALEAGRFPEIVTHYWIDRNIEDSHCDPRCFKLDHLYELIAAAMGHGPGSTYGIKPNYGTKKGTHNVWWLDTVCGSAHP